jgi:hypothetical protein
MPKSHHEEVVERPRPRPRTFKELDSQLDLELEQTFPASDALQIIRSAGAATSAPPVSDETDKGTR